MKFAGIIVAATLSVLQAHAADCSKDRLEALFSPPTEKSSSVVLNCSTKLNDEDIIKREVRFLGPEGSNSVLDCQGASLKAGVRINSRRVVDANGKVRWLRPENITIKNCKIGIGIRVSGIKEIGGVINHPDILASSRLQGHTIRTQRAAPVNIKVENSVIEAFGGAPIYIDGGTVGFSLINSSIKGYSKTDAVYLDAESADHVFSGNTFDLDVARAIISIDGSAKNKIVNNKFNGKRFAGIWVFRNCGEKGLVRHQTPHGNLISGNVFASVPGQVDPDIWIGSRNRIFDDESFCWEDKKLDHIPNFDKLFGLNFKDFSPELQRSILKAGTYGVGSSKYNVDMAKNNEVTNNITSLPVRVSSPQNIIRDNEAPKVIRGPYYKECSIQGDNKGCLSKFVCPKGGKIQAVKVACNLEIPNIQQRSLYLMGSANRIKIIRSSVTQKDSSCAANDISLKAGEASLSSLLGQDTLRISCKDMENDGGDCAVRAEIYCEE